MDKHWWIVDELAWKVKADRRLELLREIIENCSFCPMCEEYSRFQSAAGEECRNPHVAGCKLEEELADENS